MRRIASVIAIVLLSWGCATGSRPTTAAMDADGYAAPAPDMVGVWRGAAMPVAGNLNEAPVGVELTIDPDGTWRWTRRGQEQASGHTRLRGSQVLLLQDKGRDTVAVIQLQRRGDLLWGVTGAFVPGAINSVQLRKAAS
jgi:hypothetical protein